MMDFLTQWAPHLVEMFPQFVDSIVQTLIMIVVVGSISLIFDMAVPPSDSESVRRHRLEVRRHARLLGRGHLG